MTQIINKLEPEQVSNRHKYQYVDSVNRFYVDLYGYYFTIETNAVYK